MITLDDLTLDEAPAHDGATKSDRPTRPTGIDLRQYVGWGLAFMSLGAAGIHLAVMGEHFNLTWYHGSFFATIAWLQLAWAAAIVLKPSRRILLAGIVGNLVVAEVWLVSRTIGIPFGPDSGVSEPAAFADILATVLEIGIVVGSLVLLRPSLLERPVRTTRAVPAVAGVGALVAALATLSLTPAFASTHSHGGGTSAAGHSHGGSTAAAGAGGAAGHSHVGATNVSITADGTSACEKSGTAVEGNSGHGHRGPVPFTPLTATERVEFTQQVAAADKVVETYPTAAAAEAAGWHRITPYVPCIAAHYLKGSALTNPFNPSEPEILLYAGTEPDSPIVGLSYLQFTSPGQAPVGFAGSNDPWHVHEYLCIGRRGVLGDTSVSEEECRARGGQRQKLNNLWMTHMWNAPGWDSRWGLFSSENPDLGGRIGDVNGTPNPNDARSINGSAAGKN